MQDSVIDFKGFEHYRFSMNELLPIEIRIRKLVEDFFANKITLFEFRRELRRMREEFEPDRKTNKKAKSKRKNIGEDVLPDQVEATHPEHPQP